MFNMHLSEHVLDIQFSTSLSVALRGLRCRPVSFIAAGALIRLWVCAGSVHPPATRLVGSG